ncbi:MAG: globin domain-containing protein [Methylococcaceae bacterium]
MKVKNRLLVKTCVDEINPHIEVISQLFYKELFHLDIHLKSVFPGNVVFLNRKFINLLATLKNVKHLETISDSLSKMGERHVLRYGAEIRHFPTIKKALLFALHKYLGDRYNEELETAWHEVFDDVAKIMRQAMANLEPSNTAELTHDETGYDAELLNEIGGEAVVFNVHQRFYDVMFDEPWLEKFFYGKSKEALIHKQTQFMVAAFNGPNNYTGDTPAFVHMHMFITCEMADVRETLLRNAILAEGLSASIAERWLKVDRAFRPAIVKQSVDDCVLKCLGQVAIVAKKPIGYIAPR